MLRLLTKDADRSPKLRDVIRSVLASAFGVQSQKNYQHDFRQVSAVRYLIVGVIFVVLFIIGLLLLVNVIVPA